MTTRLDGGLAALAPVSLEDLDEAASLQTRRDRKYLAPVPIVAELVARLNPGARILEIDGRRSFRYQSVYLDTPELVSYLAAARRRPNRFKVRTRTYLDSGRSLLEVKTRDGRGQTVKERLVRETGSAAGAGLWPEEVRHLAGHPLVGPHASRLRPVLVNRYARTTLLLAGGAGRLTIDLGLVAATGGGLDVALRETAVVETKSSGAAGPADRILWELGVRPARVSKFCTSLAAMRPDLPANRWTQALHRPWIRGASGLRLPAGGGALALAASG